MNGKINLLWKKGAIYYSKEILKSDIISYLNTMEERYPDNIIVQNMIGYTYLCSEFYINWDRSGKKSVNLIAAALGKIEVIEIPFVDFRVLAFMQDCCKDGTEISSTLQMMD